MNRKPVIAAPFNIHVALAHRLISGFVEGIGNASNGPDRQTVPSCW